MSTIVTLLTDFGTTDYYVGAVKGTLLRLAPGVLPVDLSHEVPVGDVEAAADLLAGAAPTFPEGTVHLAVIDPGVGSDRRILVAESGAQRFVAPDNGILSPFLPAAGDPPAASSVRSVERGDLFLEFPGATFHGRDRFAPVAAALLRGEALESFGPEVADPVRLEPARPQRESVPGALSFSGRIVRVDRFGNLVTDLPAAWLDAGLDEAPGGASMQVELAGHRATRRVSHYAELPTGEPGFLSGSRGTVEVSLRGESLADRWRVGRGTPVRVVIRGR
jgi:hypothetical protein